jgi:hypothetical protein
MKNKILTIFLLSLAAFSLKAENNEYSRIPIEVGEVENDIVRAKIVAREDSEGSEELSGIAIEGKKSVLEQEGNIKKLKILWTKLKLDGQEEELNEPFVSNVTIEGSLEEGDEFSARVKSSELLDAFYKLKSNLLTGVAVNNEVAEQEEKEDNVVQLGSFANNTGSNSSGIISDDESGYDSLEVSPNYEVVSEYETSDGCDYRLDYDNMLVVVQTRKLKGDSEVSPCADSEVSFSLNKDYESCGVYADIKKEKVFSKYRITYENIDKEGVVQVTGCQVDEEKSTKLERDYESCGIKHDNAQERSFARYRLTYKDSKSGESVIYQDCVEDEKLTYPHFSDNNVCESKIEDAEVVFFERKGILVNGKTQYIGDCQPIETASKIYEEICSQKKYTHDFKGEQTFLNKNHFYFKKGERVDISLCAKSDIVLPHKYDTAACSVDTNFNKKTSQIYARTFIEDSSLSGGKVFITECEPIGSEIAHVTVKSRWVKETQEYKRLDSIADGEYPVRYIPYGEILVRTTDRIPSFSGSRHITYIPHNQYMVGKVEAIKRYYNINNLYNSNGVGTYKDWDRDTKHSRCSDLEKTSNWHEYLSERKPSTADVNKVIVQHINSDLWSFGGNYINRKYSDASPTASSSLTERKCPTIYLPQRYQAIPENNRGYATTKITIYDPKNYFIEHKATVKNVGCQVSTMARKPIYQTLEGVEYIDENTTLETMYVCGTGAKIEGLEI